LISKSYILFSPVPVPLFDILWGRRGASLVFLGGEGGTRGGTQVLLMTKNKGRPCGSLVFLGELLLNAWGGEG